ncbi:hypothetical protein ACVQTW_001554 [Klebsiella aerogenes]|nr:hypothetical protein [Klebsiella aerogenes]
MLKNVVSIILCVFAVSMYKDSVYLDYKEIERLISYGEVEDYVTLQLHDMQYACGECNRLYRVDKIISSENAEDKYYLNKEIKLLYLNNYVDKEYNSEVCASNKYHFVYTGYFRRNSLGVGRLDVTDGYKQCE